MSFHQNGNGNGNGHGGLSRFWPFRGRNSGVDFSPYRQLAARLNQDLPHQEMPRSLLLATASGGGFQSYSAAALARAFAEHVNRPVLLVDATLGSVNIGGMLGSTSQPGLAEFLERPDQDVNTLICPTSHPLVSFLPSGAGDASHPPSGAGLSAMADTLSARFDFVVYCGGSVTRDPIALALVPLVGCVLLLAIENETRLKDLDLAQDMLSSCNARQIGIVLARSGGDR